jgi:hypothetical protein
MANYKARLVPAALILSVAGNVLTLTGAVDLIVPEASAADSTVQKWVTFNTADDDVAAEDKTAIESSFATLINRQHCTRLETSEGLAADKCSGALHAGKMVAEKSGAGIEIAVRFDLPATVVYNIP